MLKKDIRRVIKETKERKENVSIIKEIFEERMNFILENDYTLKNFKKLPSRKQNKIVENLMFEFYLLNQTNLLKEEMGGFMDIIQNLFGGFLGKSAVETIAEPLIGKVLTTLGLTSDSLLKKTMISALTSKPDDLVAAFSDCKKMTRLLVFSFMEGIVMVIQKDMKQDGWFMNYTRNIMGDKLKNSDMVTDMMPKIEDKVCGMFDMFTSKASAIEGAVTNNSGV